MKFGISKPPRPVGSVFGPVAVLLGEQLFFDDPVDLSSAQDTSHYRVTQAIGKKKTSVIPVLLATYNAGDR